MLFLTIFSLFIIQKTKSLYDKILTDDDVTQYRICVGNDLSIAPPNCQSDFNEILDWRSTIEAASNVTQNVLQLFFFEDVDVTSVLTTNATIIYMDTLTNLKGGFGSISGHLEIAKVDQFIYISGFQNVFGFSNNLSLSLHYSGINVTSTIHIEGMVENTPLLLMNTIKEITVKYDKVDGKAVPVLTTTQTPDKWPAIYGSSLSTSGELLHDLTYTSIEDGFLYQIFIPSVKQYKYCIFNDGSSDVNDQYECDGYYRMKWDEAISNISQNVIDENQTCSIIFKFVETVDISGKYNFSVQLVEFHTVSNNITKEYGKVLGKLELINSNNLIVFSDGFDLIDRHTCFATNLELIIHNNNIVTDNAGLLLATTVKSLYFVYDNDFSSSDYVYGYITTSSIFNNAYTRTTIQPVNVNPFSYKVVPFEFSSPFFQLSPQVSTFDRIYFKVDLNSEERSFCVGMSLSDIPPECNDKSILRWSDFIQYSRRINGRRFDIYFIEPVQCFGEIESNVSNIILHNLQNGHASGDIIVSHVDTFIYATKGNDEHPNYLQNINIHSQISGNNVTPDADVTSIDCQGSSVLIESNVKSLSLIINNNEENVRDESC